jgi:hypothetical protein
VLAPEKKAAEEKAAAEKKAAAAVTTASGMGGLQAQKTPPAASDAINRSTLRIELQPYDDSLERSQIDAVLRSLPPRRVDLPAGGTISKT